MLYKINRSTSFTIACLGVKTSLQLPTAVFNRYNVAGETKLADCYDF